MGRERESRVACSSGVREVERTRVGEVEVEEGEVEDSDRFSIYYQVCFAEFLIDSNSD
jgi:hypothetical protein